MHSGVNILPTDELFLFYTFILFLGGMLGFFTDFNSEGFRFHYNFHPSSTLILLVSWPP